MSEFLFEIGVEELPALAVEPAALFIKNFLLDKLAALNLSHEGLQSFATPRRLVVLADNIDIQQKDTQEEILGPLVSQAYTVDKEFSPQGLGFLKAKGIDKDKVYIKKSGKNEVIAALIDKPGLLTKDILPGLLVEMMHAIPFKKRMRWTKSDDSFARPVRWMVCLYNKEYLNISFADVVSANESRGHRFMSPDYFLVTSNSDYLRELKNRYVILSSEERQKIFLNDAHHQLSSINADIVYDEDLMATVRNLMEYPFAILGKFEESYLSIPQEILIIELKNHQKCFAIKDKNGSLMPYFICSAATKPYDKDIFAEGNAKVVRARFEDGAFYFALDKETPLIEASKKLDGLVFERELGTMADKSDRIRSIIKAIGNELKLSAIDLHKIDRAALLCKADLVSGVVGQFPELQGVMGRIYANLFHEDKDVADMIEQHYWPRFADDALPLLRGAAIISIADRLDTLVGVIAIGKRPQGNKDPFALRRHAIALVRIIIHFGFNIDIDKLISITFSAYQNINHNASKEVGDFISQRAYGILLEELSKDDKEEANKFVEAVFSAGHNNMLDTFARAHTLLAMKQKDHDEFFSLIQAFKRASNIVKKANLSLCLNSTKISLLILPIEQELIEAINQAKKIMISTKFNSLSEAKEYYHDLFTHIKLIKPKLDEFFANVMVMVDDESLKHARLALLNDIKLIADSIADFTHL